VRKSSPKKRILKNSEVDEFRLGSFCLINIEDFDALKEEVSEELSGEVISETAQEEVSETRLEKQLKEAYDEGFARGRREGFEAGKKEGFKAGYEDGFKKGQTEGLEKGRKEGFVEGKKEGKEAVLKRYSELIDKFNRLLSQLDEVRLKWKEDLYNSQDRIVNLVILALSKLVMAVPEEDRVRAVVEACLEKVVEMEGVKLRLNPKDWELVRGQIQLPPSVRVELDETLERGDCVVETESGSAETRIRERMEDIISLLTEDHV